MRGRAAGVLAPVRGQRAGVDLQQRGPGLVGEPQVPALARLAGDLGERRPASPLGGLPLRDARVLGGAEVLASSRLARDLALTRHLQRQRHLGDR